MGFKKLIGVRQNMISDKGGEGGLANFRFFLTRGAKSKLTCGIVKILTVFL